MLNRREFTCLTGAGLLFPYELAKGMITNVPAEKCKICIVCLGDNDRGVTSEQLVDAMNQFKSNGTLKVDYPYIIRYFSFDYDNLVISVGSEMRPATHEDLFNALDVFKKIRDGDTFFSHYPITVYKSLKATGCNFRVMSHKLAFPKYKEGELRFIA